MRARTLIPGAAAALVGCSAPKMATVLHVDLDRFMGRWYVIAHIPASLEREAYNEVETYEMLEDGRIQTTLTFRKGAFDGPLKEYRPVASVHNTDTNAEWRMQFVWPFKSEYLVVYLDESYEVTVIGRSKRDYAWIMARTPSLPDAEYDRLVSFLADRGYDPEAVRKVPQTMR